MVSVITRKRSIHNQACQCTGMEGRSSILAEELLEVHGILWRIVIFLYQSVCWEVVHALLGSYTCMFMQAALTGLSGLFLKIKTEKRRVGSVGYWF